MVFVFNIGVSFDLYCVVIICDFFEIVVVE